MLNTVRQTLALVKDFNVKRVLDTIFTSVVAHLHSVSLNSAGLVIKGVGSALVKTGGSAWYGLAAGKLVTKGAATDMAALSGTVTNAKFNVYVYEVTSAGTLSTTMGTEGATLDAVKFPEKTATAARIGFTIINPTGTGNFVGGTTPIDDATVVPNAVHISLVGACDPTIFMS